MLDAFEYRDWCELRSSLLEDLFPDGRFIKSRFLFRGQSSADWPLVSAYDRWFDQLGLNEGHRTTLAQRLKDVFKQELQDAGHSELHKLPDEWILSLGQHNGLPTRLLDWSESPYIAAMFAFMDVPLQGSADSKVCIWALDTSCYHWSPDRGAEIVRIDNPGSNLRLRNQEGRFTLLRTPHKSLDDYVGSFRRDETKPLWRFLVPAAEAVAALSELTAMGITPARIYPDLHGLASSAKLHCHLGLIS